MNQDLLKPKQLIIKDGNMIKIYALDKKCSRVYIQVFEKSSQNGVPLIYAQTFEAADFNHLKMGQSILFLKLVIESCIRNSNQKFMQVEKVQNLIWQKIVVGKDKIDAALLSLRKKQPNKKYEGILLNLQYPENILIILPKIVNNFQINLTPKSIQKIAEQQNIKKIFFSTNN